MTQDEIIEMARQVGFSQTEGLFRTLYICSPSDLKAFAKLVADKEREECAKLVEDYIVPSISKEMSRIIRARGIEA